MSSPRHRSTTPSAVRRGALFGLAGPAVFVTGWLTCGLRREGYSFRRDAISQLARRGTANRALMTAAMLFFGCSMPIFGRALTRALGDPELLEAAVALAGVGTIAVGAFPLGTEPGGLSDRLHNLAAIAAYTGTAGSPLLASRALRVSRPFAAAVALDVGCISVLGLALSARRPSTGLYQRIGLTVVDIWFMAVALEMLR